MKLDLLCELDLLSEKLEMAALSPKYILYQIEDPEEIESRIYETISLLDNAIEILKGYLSPECTFITRFYYELQANVLESNNPTKITNFYDIRIKDIMQHIEDDEDNFTQTEHILSYLRNNHNKGLISESAKEKIERKRYYLTGLWLELFDWVRGDLESIKSGSSRPKKEKAAYIECPEELAKIFDKATDLRLMEKHGEQWKWTKSASLYGYFIASVSGHCDMRDKSDRIRWKAFSPYIINHTKLLTTARQELSKYQNETQVAPTGSKKVDSLFT